jgi:hypothetical protein
LAIVIVCPLRNNDFREGVMIKIYLLTAAFLLFLMPVLCFAFEQSALPKPSGGLDTQRNTPDVIQKPPQGLDHQGNTSNPTSHYLGIDSQGNTSVLTPNHSGGYIGVDNRGSSVTITPLRGDLGVDSNGNIWTIKPI